MPFFLRLPFAPCVLAAVSLQLFAQAAPTPSPTLWSDLQWRLIGPFRAGRVVAVSGVPGGGSTFLFGNVDGGVWRTDDAGTVWKPTFDAQPVGSIGSLAVAPSNPQIVYAGTGESDIRSDLASGNGVYRSGDGGATWTHIGLADTRQISRVLVDPRDANTVYVGALGHAYGPNPERGVYKSTDGGAHWQHVLDHGPSVGIADLALAAGKPDTLWAATWNAHRPTWSTYAPLEGEGNGLWHSTDGGAHWTEATGGGLPAGPWGRTGIAVSADGQRVYATLTTPEKGKSGLYRSDDAGATWTLANTDPRLTSRAWYFSSITIDPQDPDTLYIPNVALLRTTDAGKSIQIVRGAPGGDDYHQVWVDPKDSDHLMLGVDQGATVSLDRGRTWTTWYNQPTAQLYHVATDHAFPYHVYGAQQDSGSIAIASRTDHGHIDTRDWFLPGGSESGYLAIDPRDENIVYLSGTYGTVDRFDRRTALSQSVTPWPLGGFDQPIDKRKYRDPWTPVLVFSPADKQSLYLGTQYVLKTDDGGLHWQEISPDLTGMRKGAQAEKPSTTNTVAAGYGVVYTIAPSPLRADQIWAGTDTGRIHLTRDGGRQWSDVTPPGLSDWSKVTLIEASHFDPGTAYAAVDRHRLDDQRPYLYITYDFGRTWQLSVEGIAPTHFLNVVREDPAQRGLLYAGTEFGVYVSFDEAQHWQPLQANLPVSSVRDLDVHGDDLVAATHGRSFWVLDDITPLRQAVAAAGTPGAYLYAPAPTVRVDNDAFLGTPLPPEEPQANNPPNGAILDYVLGAPAQTIRLEIADSKGTVIRHFSSDEPTNTTTRPLLPIAERWFPKPQTLGTTAGQHRFVWDLAAGGSGTQTGDDDADEAGMPAGPRVAPGTYSVRLLVDGKPLAARTLTVTMDPRSTATTAVMDEEYTRATAVYSKTVATRRAMAELDGVEAQLTALDTQPAAKNAVDHALRELKEIRGAPDSDADADARKDKDKDHSPDPGLAEANSGLGVALRMIENGDRPAPQQALTIFDQMGAAADKGLARWAAYKREELPRVNAALTRARSKPIEVSSIEEQVWYAATR